MKNIFVIGFCVLAVLSSLQTFGQKKVTVLGSSTAAGTGASPGFGWVDRLRASFNKNSTDGIDTVVNNRAVGGYVTYKSLPTNHPIPADRPAPDPNANVTYVLNESQRPDVVIINYPTNDIALNYNPKEMMDNLRVMFQQLNANGIRTFISTTQPRDFDSEAQRLILKQLVDSIQINFGNYAINFWDDLVSNDGLNKIRPEVSANDGVHVNDLGHQLLFERVQAKNIFNATPPPTGSTTRIEAENYSNMSGVANENTSDAGGGQNVGYIDISDWMDYSVNVSSAGGYAINLRVASPSGGQLQIKNASGIVLATVAIPNTGGWQNWQTVSANVTLQAGTQTIRVQSTSNGWNFNWWEISSPGSSLALSAKVGNETSLLLQSKTTALHIYPNPVANRFYLKVDSQLKGKVKVSVVNISGQIIKQFTLNKVNQDASQWQLSIEQLPKGKYLLQVSIGKFNQTAKLIKE